MAYIATTWVNTTNPALNAANLNKLEGGVVAAHAGFEAAQATANTAATNASAALSAANAAGANANAAVVTANAASTLATAVNNEVNTARGGQPSLDARLDIFDTLFGRFLGGNEDDRNASNLPDSFPDGFGFTTITANSYGWPGSGRGRLVWYKDAGSFRITQVFYDVNEVTWVRETSANNWTGAVWSASGGTIPSPLASANVNTYPKGITLSSATTDNGFPSNGMLITYYNGQTTGAQWLVSSTDGGVQKRFSAAITSNNWSAWDDLAGGGGGSADTLSQETIDRNLRQLASVGLRIADPYESIPESSASSIFDVLLTNPGFAASIGNPGNLRYLTFAFKAKDPEKPVTRIGVYLNEASGGANTGALKAVKVLTVAPPVGQLTKVTVDFGSVITITTSMFLGVVADGPISFFGRTAAAGVGIAGNGYLAQGVATPDEPSWNRISAPNEPMVYWVETGLELDALADVALSPSLENALESADAINLGALRDLQKALVNLETSQSVSPSIAIIGDSWTASLNSSIGYWDVLAEMLYQRYGFGGHGWISFSNSGSNGPAANAARAAVTFEGTLTRYDEETAKGLSLSHVELGTGAALQVVTVATECAIHYLRESVGGVFRILVDGSQYPDGATTFNTTNASEVWAKVDITGLTDATHTIRIERVSGAPIILGADPRRPAGSGIVIHSLGNGGSHTADWATAAATQRWKDSMDALNPNCVVIFHGTNDQAGSRTEQALHTNFDSIIASIKSVVPQVDFLLISPGDNSRSGDPFYTSSIYTMEEYDRFIRRYAIREGLAFISSFRHLGPYAEVNARGLMEAATPSLHLNSTGGKILAKALFRHLYSVLQPTEVEPVSVVSLPYFTGAASGAIAAAERVYLNAMARRKKKNLRGATHFRSRCWITAPASAGAIIQLKYSPNGIDWTAIGSPIPLDSAVERESALEFLPYAARAEVFLAWFESGGNGSTSHTNWDLNTEFYRL